MKIGIIGVTGRIGRVLAEQIMANSLFELGASCSRSNQVSLDIAFKENDCLVDFSAGENIANILAAARKNPKAMVLCSSGWQVEDFSHDLAILSRQVPVIIAHNTSYLVAITKKIVTELARKLGDEYDIDLIDRHHRNKVDQISGTTTDLIRAIMAAKSTNYMVESPAKSPRADNVIAINSERRGNLFGSHEIIFTSADEAITIKQESFNRNLYVNGAIKILNWLKTTKPKPAIYDVSEIYGL